MSAESFRRALNNIPQLKYWASGQADTSSVLSQTRESSKKEIRQSKVDQIIPLEQLTSILGPDTANAIFKEIKTGKYLSGFEDVVYVNQAGQESIIFKQVTFDNLNKYVADYLQTIAQDANALDSGNVSSNVLNEITSRKYQKGHVFGWANTLVYRTKSSIGKSLQDPSRAVPAEQLAKEVEALDKFIDTLLDVLEEYDMVTSDIRGLDAKMFAKYRKTDENWLIEWQLKEDNEAAGRAVGRAVGLSQNKGIKGFLKEVGYGNASLVQKALTDMVKGFVDAGLAKTGSKSLVDLESSPSITAMVEDTLIAELSGKPKKLNKVYQGDLQGLADISLRKVAGAQQAKQSVAKAKAQLKALKQTSKTVATKLKSIKGQPVSLTSLQSLIASKLTETIKQNMGDGSRKDILNLRTGRFAESVVVERLTASREGMITAFYTYMKNPYATFSQGGRQSKPSSRDPKLLIARSIREIAATKVANRLRAVLV